VTFRLSRWVIFRLSLLKMTDNPPNEDILDITHDNICTEDDGQDIVYTEAEKLRDEFEKFVKKYFEEIEEKEKREKEEKKKKSKEFQGYDD